jgi:hypothetical protein
MMAHHVNPVAIVKAEPADRIQPDMPASLIPPWAVKVVSRRKQGRAVEPVIPKDEAPWKQQVEPASSDGQPRWYDGAEQDAPPSNKPKRERRARGEPTVKRARGGMRTWKPPATTGRGTKANQALASTVQLCSRNYAAVDAKRESYGLIDQGMVDAGTRTMVIHVKRRQIAWDVLNVVKPGSILAAKSRSGRGSPTPLRVRFTTPNKYYSPGCKVTSMTIGIDEADWQSLMAKARRI